MLKCTYVTWTFIQRSFLSESFSQDLGFERSPAVGYFISDIKLEKLMGSFCHILISLHLYLLDCSQILPVTGKEAQSCFFIFLSEAFRIICTLLFVFGYDFFSLQSGNMSNKAVLKCRWKTAFNKSLTTGLRQDRACCLWNILYILAFSHDIALYLYNWHTTSSISSQLMLYWTDVSYSDTNAQV